MVKVPIVNLYKYKFLKFSSIFKASPYDNGDKTLIFHYQLPIYIYFLNASYRCVHTCIAY